MVITTGATSELSTVEALEIVRALVELLVHVWDASNVRLVDSVTAVVMPEFTVIPPEPSLSAVPPLKVTVAPSSNKIDLALCVPFTVTG